MHPIVEDLNWRHTVKAYTPNSPISEADLAVILQTLRLSASSINSQPWRFVVLESEQAKQRFHDSFQTMHFYNQAHAHTASHIILLAYNPSYSRADYAKVVNQQIKDGRLNKQDKEQAMQAYGFAEAQTNSKGDNSAWSQAQLYLALGNVLHTLARLKIGSTPIEGIEAEVLNAEFAEELAGYVCPVALAIGYSHPEKDHNARLPKSRLDASVTTLVV